MEEVEYDCVVLDRLVPDGDSLQLVEEFSSYRSRPAVLVLSGLGSGDSRVDGLESGADDYIAKPVALDELVVRVRKLLVRRTTGETRVRLGRVTVDLSRRRATLDGEEVHLTPTQYAVFEQLVLNRDRVIEQGALLEHCWDAHRDPFSNPLHSQITRLRSAFRGVLAIDSIRGSGYVLRVDPRSADEE